MTDSRLSGLTLERIAIDYGIELLFLRDQYWLSARFASGQLSGRRLEVSTPDLLSLLQTLLHVSCEIEIHDDGGLAIAFDNRLTIEVRPSSQFEAWELVSSSGDRWICMPSGEVAIWTGH